MTSSTAVAHITATDAPELGPATITIYPDASPDASPVAEGPHFGDSAYVRDELVPGAPIFLAPGEAAQWRATGDPREVERGYFVVGVERV